MSDRIYRTRIEVVVLSDEPYRFDTLGEVAYDIRDGDCSGAYTATEANVVFKGAAAVAACQEQGTDPEFFMMGDDGECLE